jgi:hypothetical protein
MSQLPEMAYAHDPVGSVQLSAVQTFPSLQSRGVPTHRPDPLHASEIVQATTSLHPSPIAP